MVEQRVDAAREGQSRALFATISAPVTTEIVVKRSRFVTRIHPLAEANEAEEILSFIRKQEWNASHNCVARLTGLFGEYGGSSDDGEPSGTAGIPMLEVLRRREVSDVLAVVTRYFGGVKLGTGGLVRAYSQAVSEALNAASILDRGLLRAVHVDLPFTEAGRFDNWSRTWANGNDAVLGDVEYRDAARFTLWVRPDRIARFETDLAAFSLGTVIPVLGDTKVVSIPR